MPLVRTACAGLHQMRPAGFRYATFQPDDGVSFAHLVSGDTEDGPSPLSQVQAYKRFRGHR